jgi:hypothetical protein
MFKDDSLPSLEFISYMNSFSKRLFAKILTQLPLDLRVELSLESMRSGTPHLPTGQLKKLFDDLDNLKVQVEDELRRKQAPIGKVKNFDNGNTSFSLEYSIMDSNAPWKQIKPKDYNMPGMITFEEILYYNYIAKCYSGWGEIVELGPWLGHSTMHLVNAFSENPNIHSKKIHVFDDFIWRSSWMDQHYNGDDCPNNHEDFRFIFERYVASIQDKIHTTKGKFTDYDGNEHLPVVQWPENTPIEIIVVDCGRTLDANNGWFNVFSKGFVPNKTLIVMQDWRLHRERPRLYYNQTLDFTKQHPNFELIHEVSDGGVATFLYR